MSDNDTVNTTNEDVSIGALLSNERELAKKLVSTTDDAESEALLSAFNKSIAKRNATRVVSFGELVTLLTDEIKLRLMSDPASLDNDQLIKYLQVIQNSEKLAHDQLNEVKDIPSITINQQNNVNIGEMSGLNKESRDRVLEAIDAILAKASKEPESPVDEEE